MDISRQESQGSNVRDRVECSIVTGVYIWAVGRHVCSVV
jgi:hypothetical protein